MISKTAQYSLAVRASRGCRGVSALKPSGSRVTKAASKQRQRQSKLVLLRDASGRRADGTPKRRSRECEVSTGASSRYHYELSAALLPVGDSAITIGNSQGFCICTHTYAGLGS